MNNEELVRLIQEGINSAEYMESLYTSNYPYIAKIANHYVGYAEFQDLTQEAYFGLYEAVKRYEQDSEVKFMTYASYWIKQAMSRYIENTGQCIRIPSHMRSKIQKYSRVCKDYLQKTGSKPSSWDLCYLLEINLESLKRIETAYYTYKQIESLEKPITNDNDSSFGDTIPSAFDLEEETIERILKQELKSDLWSIVDKRTTLEEKKVIYCRYQKNMTMKEIGEAIGQGVNKVRAMEDSGLRKLRTGKVRRMLQERYEVAFEVAYRGSLGSFRNSFTSSTERAALKLI